MVEKLKAYKAELEAKAEALRNVNVEIKVQERLESMRAQFIEDENMEISHKLNKLVSDIACVDEIIVREEAEVAEVHTVSETNVEEVVENIVEG